MTRAASPLALALAGLVAGAALAGCGGGSGDADAPVTTGGTAATAPTAPTGEGSTAVPSGYPTAAAGLDLTAPGTALELGQDATVAWQPSQHLLGALDVSVTALHSTSFKQSFQGWQLDEATRATAPYFVTATVRNAGSTDLSGKQVPLYGTAASGALVEASSFATDFKPCGPSVLPTPFAPGARTKVCLVYLVPSGGHLDGITFRPTEDFDPITWSGEVTPLAPVRDGLPLAPARSGKASPSGKPSSSASPG